MPPSCYLHATHKPGIPKTSASQSEFFRLAEQHFANGGVVGRLTEPLERSLVAQQAVPQARQQVKCVEIGQRFLLAVTML
jgi:hypothetical protein